MRVIKTKLGEFIRKYGGVIQTGPFGSQLHKSDYRETGTPVIMPKDIINDRINTSSIAKVDDATIHRLSRHILQYGDIVYPRRGDLNKRAIVTERESGWLCGTGCMKISVQETPVLPKYLFYFLKRPDVVRFLENKAIGATMPNLSGSLLGDIEIDYPSIDIQYRIASTLSAYDDLIENNNRRIALLEESMQLLYKEWFVHFRFPGLEHSQTINGVPDGWVLRKLLDVTQYINRGISPKYGENETRWVINQKCIRDGRLNTQLARTHTSEYSSVKEVQFGDVLVNSTGIGTLGRVTQVYEELKGFTVDSHVTIVRPNEKVCVDYFGLYLLTLQPYFDQMGAGSTGQTELSRGSVANADFLLPPFSLQEKFGTLVSPQRHLVQNLLQQNKQLAEARDLLLPRLMSGEIPV